MRASLLDAASAERDAERKIFRIFVEGDDLFDAMLADIEQAAETVRMETYIFADDEVGSRFVEALCRAASGSTAIVLRLDAFGAWNGLGRDSEERLLRAGVLLRWSRAWSWRSPFTLFRRNHRKLLIVDGRVAYLGGFNIHRENSRRAFGEKRWRDSHVRVMGPAVQEAIAIFNGRPWVRHSEVSPDAGGFSLLPHRTLRSRHRMRSTLRHRFATARDRIWITTPYFLPDRATQKRLCEAVRRGVEVRLLVPGENDVPIAQWASRAGYHHLLAAGVRIWEYQPRILHAKTILIDRDWATIGSANLDFLSFFVNDEVNLVGTDPGFNAELADHFASDCREAIEMTLLDVPERPHSDSPAAAVAWWLRQWL